MPRTSAPTGPTDPPQGNLPMPNSKVLTRALILAAIALSAPTAHAMTVGEIDVVCPIDGKRFKTITAFSGSQFGMQLDLKPVGPTPAPWPLAKCPGNGFVVYKKTFSAEELARLRPYVRSEAYRALVPGHTNYFLAAKLQQALNEPPARVAITLLQATSEARDDDQYRAYATEALAAYEQVLQAPPKDEVDRLTAVLVAGELERRLGRFDLARSRFLAIPNRDSLAEPMDRIVALQLSLIEKGNSEPAEIPPK